MKLEAYYQKYTSGELLHYTTVHLLNITNEEIVWQYRSALQPASFLLPPAPHFGKSIPDVSVSMDENNVNQNKSSIKLKQILTAEKLCSMQYALQCQKNSLIKTLQYNARFKQIL